MTARASDDLPCFSAARLISDPKHVVGRIPSGLFPREMALLPNGTLLVSNFESGSLEAVDVAGIPGR